MLFARLFGGHLAEERTRLVALSATPAGRDIPLRDYDRRVSTLRADYSAHVNGWTPAAIAARWPDYVEDVRRLQTGLREMMAWEERTLPATH